MDSLEWAILSDMNLSLGVDSWKLTYEAVKPYIARNQANLTIPKKTKWSIKGI